MAKWLVINGSTAMEQNKWIAITLSRATARDSVITIHKFCSVDVGPLITNHGHARTSAILSVIQQGPDLQGTMWMNKDCLTPNHKHVIKHNKLSNFT